MKEDVKKVALINHGCAKNLVDNDMLTEFAEILLKRKK